VIEDPLTEEDFDIDWRAIEEWAQQVATIAGKQTLVIPRKGSMLPVDLTTNWLAIENWANSL
jgi:hypothetical protein